MQIILPLLFCVAAAAGVQVLGHQHAGYIAPQATSFFYKVDNGVPASGTHLSAPYYRQPQAFAPPLPISQPVITLEPSFVGPVRHIIRQHELPPAQLPYIIERPIRDKESDEEDDSSEEGVGLAAHRHAYEKGYGNDYDEHYQAAHGEKGSKGYNSQNRHEKGASGKYGKEHDEGYHSEEEGEKGSHYNEAGKHGANHESSKGYKGADHEDKKHHSKGEEVTGYHKVYNKDEFKKDHDFYDVSDKRGNFNKYGYAKENHGAEEAAHKEEGKHTSGRDQSAFGKKGYHAKGHHDDNDHDHSADEGEDNHYHHASEYNKKGESFKTTNN